MTLDLRKVRKAVAGLVGSAITAGVSLLTLKVLHWAPEATAGVSAALVAATTGLIYKIPNEVTF